MKTFDKVEKVIDICNEYPSCKLPYDGVTSDFIYEEMEKFAKDFGRHILQITNNVIKKHSKMKPLNENSGEELLEDLFKQWNENE